MDMWAGDEGTCVEDMTHVSRVCGACAHGGRSEAWHRQHESAERFACYAPLEVRGSGLERQAHKRRAMATLQPQP